MTSVTSAGVRRQLYELVDSAAPDGWSVAHIHHIAVGKVSESEARVVLKDGSTRDIAEKLGWDFDDLTDRLKSDAYRESRGSWFTAELTLERAGKVIIDFDYDDEPKWSAPVVAMTYVEEQERFPRAVDSMPDWFAEKLREADGDEG